MAGSRDLHPALPCPGCQVSAQGHVPGPPSRPPRGPARSAALHQLLSLLDLRFPPPVGPSAAPQLTSEGPGVTFSDSSVPGCLPQGSCAHTRLPRPRCCAPSPLWVSASGHVLRAAFPVPLSPLCHLPGVTTVSSRWYVHEPSESPPDCPPTRTGTAVSASSCTGPGFGGRRACRVVPVLMGRPREEGADLMASGGCRLLTCSPAGLGLSLQR